MALEQITDHVARALSRVVTQLRGSEFEALCRVFAAEVQILEDALISVLAVQRNPATATGKTLDLIGRIVGAEPRGPLSDADYRLRIGAAIARNNASGKAEETITLVLTFFGAIASDVPLIVRDAAVEGIGCAVVTWASFNLADNYAPITPAQAEELMRYLSRAAGTRVIFSYASSARDGADTLGTFDQAGNGFDGSPGTGFSGSVDQKTRNE